MKVQPMRLLAPVSNGRSSATVAVEAGATQLQAANEGKPPHGFEKTSSTQLVMSGAASAQFRTVKVGVEDPSQRFPPNIVKTSVYTPLSFLPKNLFKQFTRFSNVYFLFITALQLIPEVTSTPGFPTMVVPLVFIMVVSAVRDLIEDLDRHRSDDLQNNAQVAKLDLRAVRSPATSSCGNFTNGVCADVRVGDLVRISDSQEVPADVVLIATSSDHGRCFVMTANLDGESTLKPRYVPAELCIAPFGQDCFSAQGELSAAGVDRIKELTIECEPPNRRIDRFEGSLKVLAAAPTEDSLDLDINHVLLKGTQLKDTRWAIGVVVYTGDDTRVRQNSSDTPIKRSWLYRFINKITLGVVLAQIGILTAAVVVEKDMVTSKSVVQNPFIDDDVKTLDTLDSVYLFLAYMLLFSNFVPISLQVTIDFTRYFQAKVIQSDPEMRCQPAAGSQASQSPNSKQTSVRVQSSELNEELGLIEHVFTDKTGTLTCNRMEFRSCHVDGKTFDFDEELCILKPIADSFRGASESSAVGTFDATSTSVDTFDDTQSFTSVDLTRARSPLSSQLKKFLLNLAVNNSISPATGGSGKSQTKRSTADFSGPSPDEKALVTAAARLNVTLVGRDNGHLTVNVEGQEVELQILHLFEFTSERKKSSIVCRHPDGKIVLYCKGADTVILRDLSAQNHASKLQQAKDHMQVYSANGLRVLCIAERELSAEEYATWNTQFVEMRTRLKKKSRVRGSDASAAESDEADSMASIVSALERNLILVGISAIEDKIQDDVPQTLEKFREAGIKVWMLTGDRPDTATNVAYAVRLISSEMRLIRLTESHWLESRLTALHFFERELKQTQGDAYISTGSFLLRTPLIGRFAGGAIPQKADVSAAPAGPRLAMILSDSAVEAIRDFGLETEFLQLCMRCESVVCARISPKQKEFIVGMVRSKYPEKVTMAVGDGANDVPMIQRAHIGVGIAGEEGNQASDASDYSIPAFRFLQKLVLVHGRSMNRRIAVLTLYIFYKNVLLVLPQFVYGIYCLFSGQSSYYDPLLQLFNICFTSLPVLFFSVFDQDINARTILQHPRLYQDGSSHAFLNVSRFVYWMFEATVASILIILIPAKLIPLVPWSGTGKDNDLWSLGLTQNFTVVFLANARLLVEVSSSHRTMVALATASVLVWWAFVYVMSSSVSFGREFYGILRVGSLTHLALCCCFCSSLSLFFAFLPRVHEVLFAPNPRTICRELDYIAEAKDRDYSTKRIIATNAQVEGDVRAVVVPT